MEQTITSEVISMQLTGLSRIIAKWIKQIDAGTPGKDLPVPARDRVESYLSEFKAEIALCGDICYSLAERAVTDREF